MATKLKQLKLDELSLVDNPANKLARVTIFKRASDPDDETEDFHTKVVEIQKRDKCTQLTALQKAREEAPDAFEAFQDTGRQPPVDERRAAIAKGRERQATVDRSVRKVMSRDGVNLLRALQTLRDEQPEIFEDETV